MRSLLAIVFSAAICLGAHQAAAEPDQAREVEPPQEAVAFVTPTQGNNAQGVIMLRQDDGVVHITGEIRGLSPGEHGFHIHEYGDLRAADGSSAGGHYDPRGHKHGGPDDHKHHAGDLGNIEANDKGVAIVNKKSKDFKLHFVIGRAVVVHGGADDFTSQPSGDAGPRVGLGVIGFANVDDSVSATPSSAASSR